MGHNFPGGYPPGGQWTRDDGVGRRRKKKGGFMKAVGGLLTGVAAALAVSGLVLALPLFMGFDPWDAAEYADAPGFAKIDAFRDGWRHKHGISTLTFTHDGRTVTFTDDNGELSRPSGDGTESDIEEALRILKEWGLKQ